jgi:hypothetical protein
MASNLEPAVCFGMICAHGYGSRPLADCRSVCGELSPTLREASGSSSRHFRISCLMRTRTNLPSTADSASGNYYPYIEILQHPYPCSGLN